MKKNKLPQPVCESYPAPPDSMMNGKFRIRVRFVNFFLKKLDANKATGPYPVGTTHILKKLADQTKDLSVEFSKEMTKENEHHKAMELQKAREARF